jgi:hypothetical protein
MIGSIYLTKKRVQNIKLLTIFIMKNTLNILKVSSVLMALTLCIGVSYPMFVRADVPTLSGSNGADVPTLLSGNNGTDGTSSTPTTLSGSNGTGGTSGTPTLGGSNDTGGTSGTPTLGASNGTGGTSGTPTLGGSNGNESVTDTTPPVISGTPADISTSTDGASVVVNYTPPTALDAVSGTVSVNCVPPSGSPFDVNKTTTVTCTATDTAHNSASTTFTVTVNPASTVVVTPETPAIVYGGGGGGSYSSGGSSIVTLATTTAPATTPILTCPLITTYMKFGGINNPTDVAKLQAFLKDSQGLDVTVNGIFDQQMENAVRAFQSKYMSQIMGPWGANQSSGYVYITTLKKVNEIACNTPLTLSPAELAIINAYKNSQTAGTNAGPTTPGTLNTPGTTNTGTTPLTPIIGQNGTSSNANVAAVGGFVGAWNNFWSSVWNRIFKK